METVQTVGGIAVVVFLFTLWVIMNWAIIKYIALPEFTWGQGYSEGNIFGGIIAFLLANSLFVAVVCGLIVKEG